jgi:hypothetical protein
MIASIDEIRTVPPQPSPSRPLRGQSPAAPPAAAQGKITINCWNKSGSDYWGGMGPRTVAKFIPDCDWHYVLNCLDRGISSTRSVW